MSKRTKKTDPRLSDTRRIKSSGNIFVDLGFDPAEAKVMALRAEVMIRMEQHLKAKGWRVTQVMNLTDVDDKTIGGASAEGISLAEFTGKYADLFFRDINWVIWRPLLSQFSRPSDGSPSPDHRRSRVTTLA